METWLNKQKTFKSLILSLLIVIIYVVFVNDFVLRPIIADVAEDEILTVAVPTDRCPIFYIDQATGEITGIGADLMRMAAEDAGYGVVFVKAEEATLKEALDNEEYDLVMPFGSAIKSASNQSIIVSDPLMQTPFTFVTEGNRVLPSINKLRVGMLRSLGGAIETLKELYPGMQIITYDTMDDSVKGLRNNEVDALLHNSYVWSYVLQKPAYNELVVQPSIVFSFNFRVGTLDTPEGREKIDRLNKGIESIKDTTRQAVILDYTSRKLYQNDFSDFIYQYGLILLLGLALFSALLVIGIQKNKTIKKENEEKMQKLLDYDHLTGVYSMNGFRKKVEELLKEHPDTPYFLSYNNIRDFKFINESLGREAGNELLKFWAKKSMENLGDEEAIGRITADRFAVLRHIVSEEKMREDEENVLRPVHDFFINQGIDYRVQITSGIYVLTPKDFRKIDVDHMLDMARVAEKRISESRKGDFEFYNPEQWQKGKRIAEIVNYLPAAIKSGDIQVWYQPQVDYETGKIIGSEALCRWDHTKLGWLYPFDFISTLEEAGLIFDLDCFVWETVCKDIQRWNLEGNRRSVSVNVSRDDFRDDRDMAEYFRNLVEKYNVSPEQLRIEITETSYVENSKLLIDTTEKLRSLGFQVEMDDFGSGYSSLNMLKEVPIDRVKLDLHFLTESGDQAKSRTIISSVVQMIHELGMEMIAEGVETVEQADFLSGVGCNEMQGYYFYKPMPVNEFEAILKEGD